MALSCDELRRLLDEEVPLTVSAHEHLVACADCRAVAKRWGLVTAELREMGREEPPSFLHGRVMSRVREERAPGSWRWWLPSLAAGLAVVAIGAWQFDSAGRPEPALSPPPSASVPPPPPASRPPSKAEPRGAPGPLRGAPTPAANHVVCVLLRADGESRPVILPETWAPPVGGEWGVLVAESGEVSPEGEVSAVPYESLEVLAASELPPGRYTLRRAERRGQ